MGRLDDALPRAQMNAKDNVEAEVEQLNSAPIDVPKDVWDMMQENGRVATEKLHDILTSPKFSRLRAGDQAKLIALAQNRAYGMPKSNNAGKNAGARGVMVDMTRGQMNKLVSKAALPEYRQVTIKDAELIEES